jgi:epidermal growth factor receptor substrate 15
MTARRIFESARLPNEVLGRIWGLSDTQGRGSLDVTEFVIAMHLLASYKGGQMRGVPNTLPAGLYEAALRKPPPPGQRGPGSRPGSSQPAPGMAPQFSGYGRPQSPIARAQVGTPLSQQSTGENWAVGPQEKARFDQIFSTIDRNNSGFISGEQAVEFFGNARLPEEILAQIWDLADMNSEGRLDKDGFAVAMYLIRQQRGTKDGRGNLPTTLPSALIPPSKRKQQLPPSQPTAPAFENAAPTKPRSAADDLFGLDAFGPTPSAPQQAPQSTGGTDAGPFANPVQTPSSPAASTQFKPFVPTSSFGQSLHPQSTGSPVPQQQMRAAALSSNDDLLGDADPTETSKITNETSELANLSNQVGNLSKQMTDLHTTRGQTEQELNQTQAQKRAFESRLGQLRQLYENEVKEVKALKDQLAAVKNDNKRLQSDYAVIDGSHQDLSTQHQQLRQQYENDQRENASLKEKIRQMNAEVDQLKPQLEKLKSDARQQKGLVAINKKQLATNEAERDRIRAEIAVAQKELEDNTREFEESSRAIETSKKEVEDARISATSSVKSPPTTSPPNVVSPAPSTSSNPFFRRQPSETAPVAEPVAHSQTNFDSIFGPSFGAGAVSAAPATSFGQSDPSVQHGTPPVEISRASSATPQAVEPPAPPSAQQITSASLPFPHTLSREESVTSSVKVAPPISRHSPEGTPRALTPSSSTESPSGPKASDDPFAPSAQDEEQESVKRTIPTGEKSAEEIFGQESSSDVGIPGAFPDNETPRNETPGVNPTFVAAGAGVAAVAAGAGIAAAATNGEDKGKGPEKDDNFDEYFGGAAHQRTASQQAADFDSAFASMKKEPANGAQSNQEFPDIQEVDDDDDSDSSEEPLGFDDDFSSKVAGKAPSSDADKKPEVASALPSRLAPPRPELTQTSSAASSLPDFSAQTPPPPDYANAAGANPSHFPREYQGLLPEREDPTSPPPAGGETVQKQSPGSETYGPEKGHAQNAGSPPPSVPTAKTSAFDFDDAFAGVGPAQVEDDSESDEEPVGSTKPQTTEFDPSFDSPAPSRTGTSASNVPTFNAAATNGSPQAKTKDDFFDFKTDATAPQAAGSGSQDPPASHDWDDLFSGLSKDTPNVASGFGDEPNTPTATKEQVTAISPTALATTKSREIGPADSPFPEIAPTAAPIISEPPKLPTPEVEPERPALGRAISTTSEHDDPILKRLTSMGWSRAESLAALEKYDYNIDKVCLISVYRKP